MADQVKRDTDAIICEVQIEQKRCASLGHVMIKDDHGEFMFHPETLI